MSLLSVRGLTVRYGEGPPVVRAVDLDVDAGQVVAVVGESGSGKTTLLRAVLGLLDPAAEVTGEIRVDGVVVTGHDDRTVRRLRGTTVGYVGQDPFGSMDAILGVGANLDQAWRARGRRPERALAVRRLEQVGVSDAEPRLRQRPFHWSGGMLQRACVVAGTALEPGLVVADEPTSALDSANARRVMLALRQLAGAALVVSHDTDLVAEHADIVLRMDDGTLQPAPSSGEDRRAWPVRARPGGAPVLSAHAVRHRYAGRTVLAAPDLEIGHGEIVGVAGPSGVGKSTLLRVLAGLEQPSSGTVRWDHGGRPLPGEAALVMQDSRGSLAPGWSLRRAVTEPVSRRLGRRPPPEGVELARRALEQVGLGDLDDGRRTRTLSGGQAQRVAIARALTGHARLILADEPTSGLDHATADRVLQVLRNLADEGIGLVVVSHDDRMLDRYADRVVVLGPPKEESR